MEKETGTFCSGRKWVKKFKEGYFLGEPIIVRTLSVSDLESRERRVMEPTSCLEMIEQRVCWCLGEIRQVPPFFHLLLFCKCLPLAKLRQCTRSIAILNEDLRLVT